MSTQTFVYRFVVANLLTLYYNVIALLIIALQYLKNPFGDPFAVGLKLQPPLCLRDPKYGDHKYVKANNVNIHYVESGDPSKTLMIFVHGFPEFWYSWRHQIVEFNKDYWCVALDMRGYGDSERPDGVASYKIENIVNDIRDLVRQLGREKCILVAHDWGGVVAFKFRDMYPDALHGLVVLSAPSLESWTNEIWKNPEQRKLSSYVFQMRMPGISEKLYRLNNLGFFDKIFLKLGKDTVTKEDVECYKYWFGKQHTLTPPINYYRANFKYLVPEKKLCEVNIPFLVAMSENDVALKTSLLDGVKKEYKYVETVVLTGCGHFMQQEDPEQVNKLIRAFLEKHNL